MAAQPLTHLEYTPVPMIKREHLNSHTEANYKQTHYTFYASSESKTLSYNILIL